MTLGDTYQVHIKSKVDDEVISDLRNRDEGCPTTNIVMKQPRFV